VNWLNLNCWVGELVVVGEFGWVVVVVGCGEFS
jgi:hypothetical protein